MNLKESTLSYLEAHKGSYVSGGKLARDLGVSRNAVWKTVQKLRGEGHAVESVTGKGYRLAADSCILSAASIERYLDAACPQVEFHNCIDSTNNRCKRRAEDGAPEGLIIAANAQSAGRGRHGRVFSSPPDCGVYFSFLLRPNFTLEGVTLVTSYTAVCLAEVLEEVCGVETKIKWVNDVFSGGHKVSGILTEASLDAESGSVGYVVVGIGVNVFDPPANGAGCAETYPYHSVCGPVQDSADIRARIVAKTFNRFMRDYKDVPLRPHLDAYRKRSLLDGRRVQLEYGARRRDADVVGVNSDLTLRVKLDDGSVLDLSCGEVHIPSEQFGKAEHPSG